MEIVTIGEDEIQYLKFVSIGLNIVYGADELLRPLNKI